MQDTPRIPTKEVAQLIRNDFKALFPFVKFSVRTPRYGSIDIDWTDGPTSDTIRAVVEFYKGSRRDPRDESTEYVDRYYKPMGKSVHFVADYISTQRSLSADFVRRTAIEVCPRYGQPIPTITATSWGAEITGFDETWRCGMDTIRDLILAACQKQDARHAYTCATEPDKLDDLAAGMQHAINQKRRPHTWNRTARRDSIEQSMETDARNMEKVQRALVGMARAIRANRLPPILSRVNTKGLVTDILHGRLACPQTDPEQYRRALNAGLGNDKAFKEAQRELLALSDSAPDMTAQDRLRELESRALSAKIDGFFPTPAGLAMVMVEQADLFPGARVLEPSGGKGDIADKLPPTVSLDVCEVCPTLREILTLKGFHLLDEPDFLAVQGEYDRILMNPPFENLADIDHVRHAFDLLAPGGLLIAVMSESPFFRSDRKAEGFRAWLERHHGIATKNPPDIFKRSDRPTGVQTRLVYLRKPAAAQPAPAAPRPARSLNDEFGRLAKSTAHVKSYQLSGVMEASSMARRNEVQARVRLARTLIKAKLEAKIAELKAHQPAPAQPSAPVAHAVKQPTRQPPAQAARPTQLSLF